MKRFVLAFVLISAVQLVSGQQKERVKLWTLYPGYIVTKDNDTIKGYLMLKNLINNQDKVFFYKNKNTPKEDAVKYKPKDIKAYKAGPRYYESFKFKPSVSTYSANDAKTYHFVLRVVDGPFSLYRWYYETVEKSKERVKVDTEHPLSSKVDLSFNEDELKYITLGRKAGGEIVDFNSMKMLMGFKKNMSKLVADYPELAGKIAKKKEGYQHQDIEKIVKEYNEWYVKDH